MIEQLKTGEVYEVVKGWFEKTGMDHYFNFHLFDNANFKINKQLDIAKIVVLKADQKEVLKEEGIVNPPDVRIFVDTDAYHRLAQMDQKDNLAEIGLVRILNGLSFNHEKDKVMYDKPAICEHGSVLEKYGPKAVTEFYRAGVEQIINERKEK